MVDQLAVPPLVDSHNMAPEGLCVLVPECLACTLQGQEKITQARVSIEIS